MLRKETDEMAPVRISHLRRGEERVCTAPRSRPAGPATRHPALRGIGNTFGWVDYSKVMTSSLLTLIPPLIIFFIFQRNPVKGIALTGIKG